MPVFSYTELLRLKIQNDIIVRVSQERMYEKKARNYHIAERY